MGPNAVLEHLLLLLSTYKSSQLHQPLCNQQACCRSMLSTHACNLMGSWWLCTAMPFSNLAAWMQAEAHTPLAGSSPGVQAAIHDALTSMCATNHAADVEHSKTRRSSSSSPQAQSCEAAVAPRDATASSHLVMAGGHDASWFCPRCSQLACSAVLLACCSPAQVALWWPPKYCPLERGCARNELHVRACKVCTIQAASGPASLISEDATFTFVAVGYGALQPAVADLLLQVCGAI